MTCMLSLYICIYIYKLNMRTYIYICIYTCICMYVAQFQVENKQHVVSWGCQTWHSVPGERRLILRHKRCTYYVLKEWDDSREKWELQEKGGVRENERRNLGKETREEQQEGKVEGPSVTWRQRRWINQPAAVTLRPRGPATVRRTLPQKHHSLKTEGNIDRRGRKGEREKRRNWMGRCCRD